MRGLVIASMLLALTAPQAAFAQTGRAVGPTMCACPGVHKPLGNNATCEAACYGTRSSPGSRPGIDYGATEAQRRQAEAAAAERARQEREDEERERLAEEQREKDKAAREAAFIRDRDSAAGTLKGSGGGTTLKGGSAAAEPVLRGSVVPDSGLRDAVADTRAGQGSVSPAQTRAWQQLNCAAFIMRHALAGVIEGGDYRNLRELAGEASKVADGGRPSVQCNPAPPFPRGSGTAPDIEKLKQVQTQMIDKAQSIGTRMEQREAALPDPARKAMKEMQAAAPTTGAKPETDIERLRRVQLALNRVNETKLDGKTTTAIQQQEKDRAEMAKLLLVAEKIEKGNVDVGINLTEEPSARRSRAK